MTYNFSLCFYTLFSSFRAQSIIGKCTSRHLFSLGWIGCGIDRGFLVCPELYCDWFSTQCTVWNQIQIFTVFWVSQFQIPESPQFHLLRQGDRYHFRSGIIYGTESFTVRRSYEGRHQTHCNLCDKLVLEIEISSLDITKSELKTTL